MTISGTIRPQKLLIVMGTRPEVIKLAPIAIAAKNHPELFRPVIVSTGQHRQMLDQMLNTFELVTDHELNIMKPDQTLTDVTALALKGLTRIFHQEKPDVVIVQGDTTSTFSGALAAFYCGIKVAHIEAGLRTHDKSQPFPEEINRRLTSQLTDYHFSPTQLSRENLLREGVKSDNVWVTGNTCIDSLNWIIANKSIDGTNSSKERNLLVTTHRRENHGKPIQNICRAVLQLIEDLDDLSVTFPVHMSPKVREVVLPFLSNNPRIKLIEPVDYVEFVKLMFNANLILTDSGGIQEEAPSIGKPVLVLRDNTERPEGIAAGTLRLVGTEKEKIVTEVKRLLKDKNEYDRIAKIKNPYGDGKASYRILTQLQKPEHLTTNSLNFSKLGVHYS